MQQQGGNTGNGAGNPVPAANSSSMAGSHSSGDHWNPFSPSSELPPSRFATPAESGGPSSPVAMGGPGSSLITAPAGSPDPFMPPPPLPAHEGPQTQPVPKHDTAAAPATAVRALTATGSQIDGLTGNRIQTPEQLRQRFAGDCRCSRISCYQRAIEACCGLLVLDVSVLACVAALKDEDPTLRTISRTPTRPVPCGPPALPCPQRFGIAPAERANAGDSTCNPPRLAAEGSHPARLGRQRSASRVIPGTAAAAGQSFRRRLQRSLSTKG